MWGAIHINRRNVGANSLVMPSRKQKDDLTVAQIEVRDLRSILYKNFLSPTVYHRLPPGFLTKAQMI